MLGDGVVKVVKDDDDNGGGGLVVGIA